MKVKNITKVSGTMPIGDPFILGAYHRDLYPKGNGKMGPDSDLLKTKNIGQDFDKNAAWKMYHGETIPGFPHHPHRGFEIITIVDEGFADHFDSKGSKGRYGNGDVQLMSAGSGVSHGEMFPLINDDKENPFRLFQIWINMSSKDKLTEPNYKMLWSEKIPHAYINFDNGLKVDFKIILGEYFGVKSNEPLPHSWAKNPNNHLGIATIKMDPDTSFTLPAISKSLNRYLFLYESDEFVNVDSEKLYPQEIAFLAGDEEIVVKNGKKIANLLILEGEPIDEPVAAYGPFVMNTQEELQVAFAEYRESEFGGWPWGNTEQDAVNPKHEGRFASYNFGKTIERP